MATYTGADKAVGYLFTASNNTAAEYSAASTYAVGAFVVYEGTLYKCISTISSPEAWTPAHWTQTTIMENAGGGGGGGTTVIANPAGTATDTLNKLQVGVTIYDVPSGGGSSGHTYSTTEQIVGTWIDGKTIYERTINVGHSYGAVSSNIYPLNYDISSIGIAQIISFEGFDVAGRALPYISYNLRYAQYLQVSPTQIAIRLGDGYSPNTDSYVTIRYTKST